MRVYGKGLAFESHFSSLSVYELAGYSEPFFRDWVALNKEVKPRDVERYVQS
jgi:hypothetical protein